MINWNLLFVGQRVRVRNTDAESIESHVWSVFADGGRGDPSEVEVPIGATGVVVEYDEHDEPYGLWVVRWDDPTLGASLFNEPFAAVAIVEAV